MVVANADVRTSSPSTQKKQMKAVQFAKAGSKLEVVTREVPSPKRGEVLIRVQACGICHSDSLPQLGIFPGQKYPIVPGHEVVGVIETLGEDVTEWRVGQRVGVGWHGGHDFTCRACRRGDFVMCEHGLIPGINMDGGYAEYMIARRESLAAVPEEITSAEVGPLLCAGITTINALRHTDAGPGEVVAVLGIGANDNESPIIAQAVKGRCHGIRVGHRRKDYLRAAQCSQFLRHVLVPTVDVAMSPEFMGELRFILSARDRHRAETGCALGGPDDHMPIGPHHGAPDVDDLVGQVDVAAPQLG